MKEMSKGFSLIEMVVAIAILGIIVSFGMVFSFDSFRSYLIRSDRDTLNSALSRARSKAMNNFYELPHGVCYDSGTGNFILFRGNAYDSSAPTNEEIKGSGNAVITSNPNVFSCADGGVVFAQLTGMSTPVEIGVAESGRVSTTTINYEGTIIW